MAITSLTFLIFVAAVVVAFHLGSSARYRQWVFATANAVFIASQVSTAPALAPLLIFVVLGYPAVHWLRRGPGWGLVLCLVLTIAAFVVLKRYAFLDGLLELPFSYLSMGLSYVLFRLIHLMVDAQSGELSAAISPLRYFNYNCNFLCFVSGPIQRYPDFAATDSQAVVLNEAGVFAAFARVVRGFLKVAVISAGLNYVFGQLSPPLLAAEALPGVRFVATFGAAAVLYTLYLYFNFSGYMDIVIGIGSLLGQNLPENFRQPFAARNFLDFWTRWHITLSEWFKTYLFNPLLKALAGRFHSPGVMPWLAVLAFFLTFLVMGLWHGTTAVFVAYGLLLGGGAAANKLWQLAMTRRLGKGGYRALAEQPIYRSLCRGATFAYFALALVCLWVDLAQLGGLLRALGAAGIAASFVVIALAGALVLPALDYVTATLRRAGVGLALKAASPAGFVSRNVALAAQVLLILMASSFFHKAPEFVYRAF
ncbi:MBOAT family O-acyltransferase [Dechloromonas sp.]|uniref:MBOAT family O-acyltransferase n=1 Tax=Dechloromonas sp. TaxID=1917218 RepID=UPI00286E62AE|nr:MBOAT family O-acyltransferase [Dechloromonas sp.]